MSLPEHTHKPWHSQAVVCGVESLSASSQSLSIRDVPTDRHTALAFVSPPRHSLPSHFFFFLSLSYKEAAKDH